LPFVFSGLGVEHRVIGIRLGNPFGRIRYLQALQVGFSEGHFHNFWNETIPYQISAAFGCPWLSFRRYHVARLIPSDSHGLEADSLGVLAHLLLTLAVWMAEKRSKVNFFQVNLHTDRAKHLISAP